MFPLPLVLVLHPQMVQAGEARKAQLPLTLHILGHHTDAERHCQALDGTGTQKIKLLGCDLE